MEKRYLLVSFLVRRNSQCTNFSIPPLHKRKAFENSLISIAENPYSGSEKVGDLFSFTKVSKLLKSAKGDMNYLSTVVSFLLQ